MFCPKCGKEIKETDGFCPGCGEKIVNKQHGDAKNSIHHDQTESTQNKSGFPFVKIILGLAAVVVLFVVILIAVFNSKPKFKLNDYVSVNFSGYEKGGTASSQFDYEKFGEDYGKKIKLTSKGKKELSDLGISKDAESDIAAFLFELAISGTLDKTSGLSNGDTVTFSWDINEDALSEYCECKLVYSDIDFTVSGLDEISTFDPFAGIEVSFEGVAPNAKATYINRSTDEITNNLSYSFDKETGLSNGDTVTLSIGIPWVEKCDVTSECIANYGKAPSQTEKTYTVEGVGKYVSEISEIPDDIIQKMISQSEDEFNARVASDWLKEETLDGLTYIGSYLLVKKPGSSANHNNILYMVFKPDVTLDFTDNEKHYNRPFHYYSYTAFYDLILLPDGTCSLDLSKYDRTNNVFEIRVTEPERGGGGYNYRYYGYADLDSLFNDAVTSNIDKYTCDKNVEDKDSKNPLSVSESEKIEGGEPVNTQEENGEDNTEENTQE